MHFNRELARDIGSNGSCGPSYVRNLPVNNEPIIDGYDELFDPPVLSDYECPICMMCLRDPVQTACGHRFCKSCLQRHMRINGGKCPSDNQQLQAIDVYDDNFAKREVSQFTVKCRTVKNGKQCPWKGELHKLENHLTTCGFVDVICTEGCGQTVERRALDNHVKKECQKRMTTCPHCKTDVQHDIKKMHMRRCKNQNVNRLQCSKKMLRKKLATHEKECPKVECDFKPYGCKWMGSHSDQPGHLRTGSELHLSLLLASLSLNGRETLNLMVAENLKMINSLEENCQQLIERITSLFACLEQQKIQQDADEVTIRNMIAERKARLCNGVLVWPITGFAEHQEGARQGLPKHRELYSDPFYTDLYGYKFYLRINPYGFNTGYGSHIALFAHMMQSEWDDALQWPFTGKICLSILDQSDDGEYKRHISQTYVARPDMLAFQRPTARCNQEGHGSMEFALLETLQERQYVKNDCLLVRVQVFY